MRICVLDPNRKTHDAVIRKVKQRHPDDEVSGFTDFFTAWKYIVLYKPEVLYTKMEVTYKTGYEIAALIKENNYKIQIIFISGDGQMFLSS